MATKNPRKLDKRKADILNELHKNGSIPIRDLAQVVDVSDSTLRRDLRQMAEAGLVQRRYGKVDLINPSGNEVPFPVRMVANRDEKQRIARAALDLLENGETIFIAGGTTTLELARLLPGQRRLTVITNTLHVANVLVDKAGINLVILGGEVRPGEQTMHGHLTEWGAQQLRANKLFYGVQALSPKHGLTHSQLLEVSTDRALANAANQVIVLVDHSKFGKVEPALVLPLSKAHTIVTGREAPAEMVEALQSQGIQLILA